MKSFKEYLTEVFDHPWTKEYDHDMTTKLKDHIAANKEPHEEFNNIKAHKLEGDNGHLMSYHRNGALEVHHMDKDFNSGDKEKTEKDTKPNPRFYSTMIHHMKEHGLDKGKPVRVVSPKDSKLSTKYKKVVGKLAKRDGYETTHSSDTSLGSHYDTIEIKKKHVPSHWDKLKESILSDRIIERAYT